MQLVESWYGAASYEVDTARTRSCLVQGWYSHASDRKRKIRSCLVHTTLIRSGWYSWVSNEGRNQFFHHFFILLSYSQLCFAAFTMYALVVILQSHDAIYKQKWDPMCEIRRSTTILVCTPTRPISEYITRTQISDTPYLGSWQWKICLIHDKKPLSNTWVCNGFPWMTTSTCRVSAFLRLMRS